MERITFYLVYIVLSIFLSCCVWLTRTISLPFISWSSDLKNDDEEKLLKAHRALTIVLLSRLGKRTDTELTQTSLFRQTQSTLTFKPVHNLVTNLYVLVTLSFKQCIFYHLCSLQLIKILKHNFSEWIKVYKHWSWFMILFCHINSTVDSLPPTTAALWKSLQRWGDVNRWKLSSDTMMLYSLSKPICLSIKSINCF